VRTWRAPYSAPLAATEDLYFDRRPINERRARSPRPRRLRSTNRHVRRQPFWSIRMLRARAPFFSSPLLRRAAEGVASCMCALVRARAHACSSKQSISIRGPKTREKASLTRGQAHRWHGSRGTRVGDAKFAQSSSKSSSKSRVVASEKGERASHTAQTSQLYCGNITATLLCCNNVTAMVCAVWGVQIEIKFPFFSLTVKKYCPNSRVNVTTTNVKSLATIETDEERRERKKRES